MGKDAQQKRTKISPPPPPPMAQWINDDAGEMEEKRRKSPTPPQQVKRQKPSSPAKKKNATGKRELLERAIKSAPIATQQQASPLPAPSRPHQQSRQRKKLPAIGGGRGAVKDAGDSR